MTFYNTLHTRMLVAALLSYSATSIHTAQSAPQADTATIQDPYVDNRTFYVYLEPALRELSSHSDYLYNLDFILESSAYKKATTQFQKENILKTGFLKRRDRLIEEILIHQNQEKRAKTMLSIAVALGLPLIILLNTHFHFLDTFIPPYLYSHQTLTASLLPLAYNSATFLYNFSLEIASDARIAGYGLTGIHIPFQATEELYARKYHLLKKKPMLLAQVRKQLSQKWQNSLEAVDAYVRTATSLPMVTKGAKFDQDIFDSYFKFYAEPLKDQLSALGKAHVLKHVWSNPQTLNFPIYFQGVPGSGKTHAVKGLAKATGVPLGTVTLDGANIEDIIGTARTMTNAGKPGRLLSALTSTLVDPKTGKAYEDGILFIDEFDRLLNGTDRESASILSFMLKALDPTSRQFFSPYLGTMIQLPKTIILAGNYKITDEALRNRFEIVSFSGFEQNVKIHIVRKVLVPTLCNKFHVDIEDLTEQQWKDMEAITAKDISEQGLRTLEKTLLAYFIRISFAKHDHLIRKTISQATEATEATEATP